ncbi:hypothetical protein H0H87_007375 [Tephrocybe sp. NHM501043]|nr:hypothetical protein H0H87_007375 [Tephrocybe sp. NHM501043]
MLSGNLPDEIVREILSPALRVSDEAFRSREAVSPFATYSESSSALLVVCKSWLRVATPLLYNVVVLRSKPQARSLECALRGNTLLGSFIKKLRLEGGLGPSMYHILRLAPNMTEMWLPMRVWSSESVTGLCRGLGVANPQHLILHDKEYHASRINAPSRKLVDTICQCIASKWVKLTTVDLPYNSVPWRLPNSVTDLCNALAEAKSLRTIILVEPQYDGRFLKAVARNLSLESVYIRGGLTKDSKENEILKKLLQFEYDPDGMDSLDDGTASDDDDNMHSKLELCTFDPNFVALTLVSESAKTEIFSNIIYFSLLCDDVKYDQSAMDSLCGRTLEHVNKALRSNIFLVSKQFFQLATQHYYRSFDIAGATQLRSCSERASANRSWAAHIVSLYAACDGGSTADFRPIISSATNLVKLMSRRVDRHTPLLDFKSLEILARNVGSKLQTLTGFIIARPSSPRAPTALYSFTVLVILDWDTPAQLKFTPRQVPKDALPCLQELSFTSTNDTFLKLLGCMTLPELKDVAFPNAKKMPGAVNFLKIHGKKLENLSAEDARAFWDFCPSLLVVYLRGRPAFNSPHPQVEKVILTRHIAYVVLNPWIDIYSDDSIRGRDLHLKIEYQDLGLVDFGKDFPALQEIQVYGCRWPTTE